MNIIGGKSSRYQLAGISIRSVSLPLRSGFIHASGFCEKSIFVQLSPTRTR